MRKRIAKSLVLSGLALVASPFCLVAQAQDYIDVEAERRAEQEQRGQPQQQAPRDPYGVKPAQSYPATSYGANSGPAGGGFDQGGAAAPVPSQGVSGGSNVGQLLLQVQQLQQEVMRLNGKVEEQAHELRTLKEQSLERYVDLDRRVSALTTGGEVPASSGASVATAGGDSSSTIGAADVSAQPGEAAAYQAAYDLVRTQQFDQAVAAFNQFLRQYPSGRFAPNAHYWLGELYLVVQPVDLESSRQAFTLLLDEYPDNAKVPDAMYKLGRVHFMKGNRDRAREYLDRVVRDYGGSNSAAARLAQEFIDENY
ncbi:tol-pal system protein YbgF [Parahaliea mediterranea]|uniref:Cell division coordinator CpoB n=1 Tax=Parahaliea mediterranea TaxID=651086 RepID=A0A939DHS8_9GAMM|nr:tol-pal system protein YbgF [Parahaliea mediterranea]MBN7798575.1 tol-pal system protein YbgF [Parahaliea mediterranea]